LNLVSLRPRIEHLSQLAMVNLKRNLEKIAH
ncbi:SRPBCC family protein, partial [Pseudomonas chlororaphis]